ncbi:carbohydrate-binding protein [Tengunoibacter tsumagoiensis]|uniref:CBM6 domain-containing protein n=1 Tax=Tengunoibacter tsumagoiensis TaxID=2014871 RepID=A0A402A194_9CHLR|nr:carbohydrate-binding protein [Tengunoibacter tsumagoiensis]GCE12903.1 hypothetical protein KTT_27620 [Tengunoibacter tsumagoiensis]
MTRLLTMKTIIAPNQKPHWSLTFLVGLLCLALLLTSALLVVPRFQAHAETSNQRPSVGLNLTEPDYDTFTDAMKTSSPWNSGSNPATVDANGWPTEDASLYVWEGASGTDGTYQLSFTGQATISPFGGTISNQQYTAATNTTTATIVITDTGPINFNLNFTNTHRTASSATNTGITNVVMMKPVSEGSTTTYAPSTIFTPYVAQAVAPYTYLRFMFGTNWNKSTNWSDRTTISYASQHKILPGDNAFEGNQMAFEYMVKIANDNNKDLYLVVPDRANTDYITKLAQLTLYGSDGLNPYTSPQTNPVWAPLKSNLHLYVEYTNEAWNFSFDQAHDLYDGPIGAQQEIANNPNSPLIYDGNTDGNLIWHRNYANRALNVSKIFRSIYGDSAMGSRVRPLLFWQYADLNNTAEDELLFLNDYYNNADGIQHVSDPHPLSYYFWGGGGAVYFNSNNDSASSVDALFASGIPQDSYQNMINIEARWARSYGLHFMSYEGSWGISGTVGDQGRVDARAKQALITSFNDFVKAGGENYTVGTFGQWNNFKTASTYPLVQAAAVVNDPNYALPAITQGLEVSATSPTIIGGPHYSITRTGLSGATTNLGNETDYLLRVDASGSYQIAVSAGNSASGGAIGVYIDSVLLTTITVPNTGGTSSFQTVVAGSTSLSAGLHSVTLRASAQPSGANAGTVNALLIQPGTGTPPTIPSPGALPSGWMSQDIGSVGQVGSASLDNGTLHITASGSDISGTADSFHFVYQAVTGDATIIARTTWLGDSNPYAKVGVMIRDSLDQSAANAITYYSPSGDTTFQERVTDNGSTNHGTPPQFDSPTWLKLVRSGSTITGFISHDGTTWTQTGSDTFAFPQTVYVGLAVDAHNNGTLVTGDLDNISLNGVAFVNSNPTPTPTSTPTPTPTSTPTSTPTPTPSGWTTCASENGTCSFSGTMVVRYGANNQFFYKTATTSIACNNATFGDPLVGTVKACAFASVPPTSWTFCASENGTCAVPGTVTVAYGANSSYYYKTVTNSISCNNATFGDPLVGTFKGCYYK